MEQLTAEFTEDPQVTATREKLNRCKGYWPAVEKHADVSRSWLSQFSAGRITNPTVNTLRSVGAACDAVLAANPQLAQTSQS